MAVDQVVRALIVAYPFMLMLFMKAVGRKGG